MVSIITPCYNAEKYLSQTVESVLSQTWQDWELLIIDDCSSDNSMNIIRDYSRRDARVRYFKTEEPSGSPTLPRNIGIENARGRYIAFLDSDDLWLPTKLEEQVKALVTNPDAAVVFSCYDKINEKGEHLGRVDTSVSKVSYEELLYGNVIGCLTGMYDTEKVGKVFMRYVGHEDYVLWLEILKKGYVAVNTCNVQAMYRVRSGSVSADKFKAARWQWNIYRNVECLSIFKAVRCFVAYAFKGFLKSLK